jgi:hypothetical protein
LHTAASFWMSALLADRRLALSRAEGMERCFEFCMVASLAKHHQTLNRF